MGALSILIGGTGMSVLPNSVSDISLKVAPDARLRVSDIKTPKVKQFT